MKLKVGQKLWWVPNYGTCYDVEVVSVGRKWAGLNNHVRININTMISGENTSQGCCYLTREEYETKVIIEKEWLRLKNDMGYMPKPVASLKKIQEARKLLGLGE